MPDDLGPDVARRGYEHSQRLVPEGPAPTGYYLTVTAQDPFEYDWRQGDDREVLSGHGDPNGELTARRGTPYVDLDGPTFWLNSDGGTTWVQVGGGGGYWKLVGGVLQEDDTTGVTSVDIYVPFIASDAATFYGPVIFDEDVEWDAGTPTFNVNWVSNSPSDFYSYLNMHDNYVALIGPGSDAFLHFDDGSSTSDPSAPPTAGNVRVYAKEVAGKTTLCARFHTGAVQVIAAEP